MSLSSNIKFLVESVLKEEFDFYEEEDRITELPTAEEREKAVAQLEKKVRQIVNKAYTQIERVVSASEVEGTWYEHTEPEKIGYGRESIPYERYYVSFQSKGDKPLLKIDITEEEWDISYKHSGQKWSGYYKFKKKTMREGLKELKDLLKRMPQGTSTRSKFIRYAREWQDEVKGSAKANMLKLYRNMVAGNTQDMSLMSVIRAMRSWIKEDDNIKKKKGKIVLYRQAEEDWRPPGNKIESYTYYWAGGMPGLSYAYDTIFEVLVPLDKIIWSYEHAYRLDAAAVERGGEAEILTLPGRFEYKKVRKIKTW